MILYPKLLDTTRTRGLSVGETQKDVSPTRNGWDTARWLWSKEI